MNTFYKYVLSFVVGVAVTAFTISVFIPATTHRNLAIVGSNDIRWTQYAFETINSELPALVDNPNYTFAVVPVDSGRGYDVIGFDTRLIARFRLTNWDDQLTKIDARMNELLYEKILAEQAAPSNR